MRCQIITKHQESFCFFYHKIPDLNSHICRDLMDCKKRGPSSGPLCFCMQNEPAATKALKYFSTFCKEELLFHQLLDVPFLLTADGINQGSGLAAKQRLDLIEIQQGVFFKL